jgi:hypothetical protein
MKVGDNVGIKEKLSFLDSEDLMNKIDELQEKLYKNRLLLDCDIDEKAKSKLLRLRIVSTQDESVFIEDDALLKFTEQSNVRNISRRLNHIDDHVEFLTFVTETVLRFEISELSPEIRRLRFKCDGKNDDGQVSFNYDNYPRRDDGWGQFNYRKDKNSVNVKYLSNEIPTCCNTLHIEELPKNTTVDIGYCTSRYDGLIELTVKLRFNGNYEQLTIDGARELVSDFEKMIRFLH